MTRKEAIERLIEYLDGELTAGTLAEFEAHLSRCGPCRAYLAGPGQKSHRRPLGNEVIMPETRCLRGAHVRCRERLGGLLRYYHRAA